MTTSHHDDVRLLREARQGDRRARERLVADHLGLVRAVAARYRDFGLSFDDLVQEGSLGLLDAIDHFDAGRGADFDTYARFRIRRAIRNALTDTSRLIRLPKQVVERRRTIVGAETQLIVSNGHAPSVEELAAATGMPVKTITDTQALASTPLSLDRPILDDGGTLEDVLPDTRTRDPADEVLVHEQEELVDEAVAELPERQRDVIVRHFGIGCPSEEIGEVARELHLSQQRTRTIERDALYRLRDRLERGAVGPRRRPG